MVGTRRGGATKVREREITSEVALCTSDGRLNAAAVGWTRHPLPEDGVGGVADPRLVHASDCLDAVEDHEVAEEDEGGSPGARAICMLVLTLHRALSFGARGWPICPGIVRPLEGVGGVDRPSTNLRRTFLGKDRP